MYCKSCGTKSDGIKKFCTNCGNPFSSNQNEVPKANNIKSFSVKNESWTSGRIIKTIVVILIIGWVVYSNVQDSADSTAIDKNNNALTAYNSGNNQQAISQFQEASNNAVTNDTKINTLKNLGYAYTSEGQNDLALSTFKQALALAKSDSFDYYLISGEIADLQNKPNSTILSFNKAYEKGSGEFQINNSLALFYLDIEDRHPEYVDYKKALTYAQEAYNLSNQEIAKSNLAIAHFFNENYSQTISLLSSMDISKSPLKLYFLGLAYIHEGDPINAKRHLRQAQVGGMTLPQEIIDYLNS